MYSLIASGLFNLTYIFVHRKCLIYTQCVLHTLIIVEITLRTINKVNLHEKLLECTYKKSRFRNSCENWTRYHFRTISKKNVSELFNQMLQKIYNLKDLLFEFHNQI